VRPEIGAALLGVLVVVLLLAMARGWRRSAGTTSAAAGLVLTTMSLLFARSPFS